MRGRTRRHQRGQAIPAALLIIAAFVSGCSSTESILGSPTPASTSPAASTASSGSFTDRMNALFFGPSAQSQASANGQDDITCPPVDIRPGTSTMAVNASGEASAMTLRYQATIARTARECAVLGATMTIKVGVHGRIILGPAGGPGRLDAPIRIALVQEGPEPKTIWTKLYRVPVTIPAGQSYVNFVHIEEDLTVPTPPPVDAENYIVYVGFDQTAPNERPARRSRRSS